MIDNLVCIDFQKAIRLQKRYTETQVGYDLFLLF